MQPTRRHHAVNKSAFPQGPFTQEITLAQQAFLAGTELALLPGAFKEEVYQDGKVLPYYQTQPKFFAFRSITGVYREGLKKDHRMVKHLSNTLQDRQGIKGCCIFPQANTNQSPLSARGHAPDNLRGCLFVLSCSLASC